MQSDASTDRNEVARMLEAVNAGSPGAEARLIELVICELRQIAAARLKNIANCDSISPTALVNEAYIKLFGHSKPPVWSGRAHFFGAAGRAMRQILIDHAREKSRQKRGGDRLAVDLDVGQLASLQTLTNEELLDLDLALQALAEEDPNLETLVELKFFVGQTTREAAEQLGISLRTANRHWQYAKARLWQIMQDQA